MKTAFVTHPSCLDHPTIPDHPECRQRLVVIEEALRIAGLFDFLRLERAPRAKRKQLARVHTPEHIARILDHAPERGVVFLDEDTFLGPASPEAALRAAGAVVRAVELALGGEAPRAFCSVRPPGHHATADRAMGFCLFNNVGVGVAHALDGGEIDRAAILDIDAHHGNGTETIFARDPRVLLCSAFQHPLYPFAPPTSARRHIVKAPLPAASHGAAFRSAITDAWLPRLRRFRPQLIFISAGFDAHFADEMSGLALTDADFDWVTRLAGDLAEEYAEGRVISVLEGGYALEHLGQAVTAHVRALMGL